RQLVSVGIEQVLSEFIPQCWEAREAGIVGIDQVALLTDPQLAIARIDDLASRVEQPQEAGAADGDVEAAAGVLQRARGEVLLDRGDLRTESRLRAGVDVGEDGTRALESHGLSVGDVVADHVEVGCGGLQSAQRLGETHGRASCCSYPVAWL